MGPFTLIQLSEVADDKATMIEKHQSIFRTSVLYLHVGMNMLEGRNRPLHTHIGCSRTILRN